MNLDIQNGLIFQEKETGIATSIVGGNGACKRMRILCMVI